MTGPVVLLEIDVQYAGRLAAVVGGGFVLWILLALVATLFLRRVPAARRVRNYLRLAFIPAAIAFFAVRQFYGDEKVAMDVATTALAAASVILALGLLDLVFTPNNLRRWFERDVPRLLLDVGRYLLIVVALAVILKIVWKEDVTPIIGALGIGGIVLGLALQEPLGNFFNGLAMLADKPFSIGDWIRIGDDKEGQVEHITWRAVKIRTMNNDYVIYPNSVVSKEKVVNFHLPSRVQAVRVTIGTGYSDPPDHVKRTIREVLAGVPGVLADPKPAIYTVAYGDFSINYEIKFFINDYSLHRVIEDQVMTRLWYAFRRRHIEIPFPVRHLFHHGMPAQAAQPAPADGGALGSDGVNPRIERAISAVAIFAGLSHAERTSIAREATLLEYGLGEKVISQGEEGSCLYAIAAGSARVAVRSEDGGERDVASLKRGDVFGEMSLLTGEPRTASVYSLVDLEVVEVGKEALAPVLAANPALAERIAEMVVLRREKLDQTKADLASEAKRREIAAAAGTLLGRIKAFFGL